MSERDLLVQTMAQLARDVTATLDGPCGTNYASWARSLAVRAQAIIDEANRRTPSPSSGVDVDVASRAIDNAILLASVYDGVAIDKDKVIADLAALRRALSGATGGNDAP